MLKSLLLYASSSGKSHIILAEESICKPLFSEATLKLYIGEKSPGASAGSFKGRCSAFSSVCTIIGVDLVATCPPVDERKKYPYAFKRRSPPKKKKKQPKTTPLSALLYYTPVGEMLAEASVLSRLT